MDFTEQLDPVEDDVTFFVEHLASVPILLKANPRPSIQDGLAIVKVCEGEGGEFASQRQTDTDRHTHTHSLTHSLTPYANRKREGIGRRLCS